MNLQPVVVLSGGGAKAAAHVGAMSALLEAGGRPQRFVATSMGSVIAACLAAGMSVTEVTRRMLAVRRRDVAAPAWSLVRGPFARSIFREDVLRETISGMVGVNRFSDLRTPLTVTAVDAATGELALFGHGGDQDVPLIDALCASCALPVYYPPVPISGRWYMDGGIRAVLPLGVAARLEPGLVFAVMVGPSGFDPDYDGGGNVLASYNAALRVMMGADATREIDEFRASGQPLVLVRPRVDARATFAVDRMVSFLEEGYRTGVRELAAARIDGRIHD